ncbi:hypothetical protein EJ04DRAFT_256820 [Polyplosphaeria fusca]|uniref:Uncharacterized protein n=1 Tax=Polyplosphaeria fusca TaxID=682080 RepID=A0A9P4QU50_9PLEO|nr:hypothetical protein EJ04DRAFT_256820 [Polyplosphaeria fusca]
MCGRALAWHGMGMSKKRKRKRSRIISERTLQRLFARRAESGLGEDNKIDVLCGRKGTSLKSTQIRKQVNCRGSIVPSIAFSVVLQQAAHSVGYEDYSFLHIRGRVVRNKAGSPLLTHLKVASFVATVVLSLSCPPII